MKAEERANGHCEIIDSLVMNMLVFPVVLYSNCEGNSLYSGNRQLRVMNKEKKEV